MTQKTPFTPTARMIFAVEAYLAARLCEAEIQPIVIGYQIEILSRRQFKISQDLVVNSGRRLDEDEIILDPTRTYRLGDEDAQVYYAECRQARAAAHIEIEGEDPDTCPLLKAHHAVVMGENEMIKSMSDIPELASFGDELYVLSLDNRKKVIELTLGLLKPFINNDRTVSRACATLAQYPRFANKVLELL